MDAFGTGAVGARWMLNPHWNRRQVAVIKSVGKILRSILKRLLGLGGFQLLLAAPHQVEPAGSVMFHPAHRIEVRTSQRAPNGHTWKTPGIQEDLKPTSH
ncbi:hypothetical protein L596_010306 [Steinernema carpocapsae]|uniref:Uncharacterized protein n=1 Tax=Steinernema carpocapsae TaxID=34508 RepID=A0A4U5PI56_STECR|nr:hypothetical protein L596_010306 [Steinernema carpocapsae]